MASKLVVKKITPAPTYTAGRAPTGYAPGGIATIKAPAKTVAKPKPLDRKSTRLNSSH